MSLVEIAQVAKSYAQTPGPLRRINLVLKARETLVLLGASGSGKTTLLRLIAGLESPTTGEVKINGRPVETLAPQDRGISFLFQNSSLASHLTCGQNILLPLRGKMHDADRARLYGLANDLAIEAFLERYPAEISAGERQRVALARVFFLPRTLLLLDEPMTHLDVPLRKSLRRVIKRHCQDSARGAMIVSHDPADAWELADTIAVVHDGQIVFHGTREEARGNQVPSEARPFLGLD